MSQNGQTHSNNSSAKTNSDALFEVFDHFVGLALKRLIMGTNYRETEQDKSYLWNTPRTSKEINSLEN